MPDLTEHFTKEFTNAGNAESPASRQAAVIRQDEDDANQKRNDSKFQSAYEQTDLTVTGPPQDKFNYQGDYEEGNTFKTDENGGTQLNNRHFRPEAVNVVGRDLVTGKDYQNKYQDPDGDISRGIESLRKEDSNTKTGPSYRNSYGLFDVAHGVMKEGGSYDDFKSQAKGPWSEDQMAIAYSAANQTKTVMDDIDNVGQRHYDRMVNDYYNFEGRIANIPEGGYTEETLAASPDWIDSGREFLTHVRGSSAANLTDEQVDKSMKSAIALFRHNLPMMMMFADLAEQDTSGEMARSLLVADEMYEALDTSGETIERLVGAIGGDATNYITLGGGIIATQLGKPAVMEGVKHSLKRLMHGVTYDVAVGAGFGAMFEGEKQNVEISAGVRKEKDPKAIATMAAIEGTANLVIGGPLNVLSDKNLRGFAGKNIKKGYDFLRREIDETAAVLDTPAFLQKQADIGGKTDIDPSITGEMFTKKQAMAAGAVPAAEATKQERDEKGRFKKQDDK